MVRYYKKHSPGTAVTLSNNTKVQFTSLDNVLGYFATEVVYVQDQFAQCMAEQRYGLSEIDAAEFTRDYLDKKKAGQDSKPLWRDELTRGQLMPSASTLKERLDAVANVVAVVKPEVAKPVPITVAEVNQDIARNLKPTMKTPAAQFRPTVGVRRAPKPNAEKPA